MKNFSEYYNEIKALTLDEFDDYLDEQGLIEAAICNGDNLSNPGELLDKYKNVLDEHFSVDKYRRLLTPHPDEEAELRDLLIANINKIKRNRTAEKPEHITMWIDLPHIFLTVPSEKYNELTIVASAMEENYIKDIVLELGLEDICDGDYIMEYIMKDLNGEIVLPTFRRMLRYLATQLISYRECGNPYKKIAK